MNATADKARIVAKKLTDNSTVLNVEYTTSDFETIVIGCRDRIHAEAVARDLNDSAWIEIHR